MTNKICPLCKKTLSLKQINFTLAVYICEDTQCKYPVGCECITVERKLEDVGQELARNEDLNDWVTDVVATSEQPAPVDSNIEGSVEWIDNLVEEAVKQANKETTGNCVGPTQDTDLDDILNFIYSNELNS